MNSSGQVAILKGLSPVDPIRHYFSQNGTVPLEDTYFLTYNASQYIQMASWGAKIVRLPVHPKYWRDNGGGATCLTILDEAINWARANQLYVVIDFHSIGFPPSEEYAGTIYNTSVVEMRSFWTTIAAHYKDEPVVAFYELFNEPTFAGFSGGGHSVTANWTSWKATAELVIDDIRAIDSRKPVIVNGLDWGYDLSYVLQQPISRDNIIYGCHPYPHSNWYRSWQDAFLAVADRYPVMVTEFGYDPALSPPNYWSGYESQIMTQLASHGISWIAWSFSPNWGPQLLADKNYTPTAAGSFFRTELGK